MGNEEKIQSTLRNHMKNVTFELYCFPAELWLTSFGFNLLGLVSKPQLA